MIVFFPVVVSLATTVLAAPALSTAAIPELLDISSLVNRTFSSQDDVLDALSSVRGMASPRTAEEGLARLRTAFQHNTASTTLLGSVAQLVAAGLTKDNIQTGLDYLKGFSDGQNSLDNVNNREPSPQAYPQASPDDAPYDLPEETLRKAIYIPKDFQYGVDGAPQPIVLVPGTGLTGYESFKGNLIPLIQESKIADPVWLNIPDQLLMDAQINAQYVAYAINYIYGISNNRKIAVTSWSQGGLISQWAYKYWPSLRARVTDHISHSADYDGTVVATFLGQAAIPLAPSVRQQEYNSNFVNALRANDGHSSWVPTTTIYSGVFDDVVEPQQGTIASAYLDDVHGAGVSNIELQTVCPLQPAGGLFLHEGPLYNNLAWELLKDALAHDGPGDPSRLDLEKTCALPLTSGINVAEFLETENSILIALLAIVTYDKGVTEEPALKSYA